MQETASGSLDMQDKASAIASILNFEPKLKEVTDLDVAYIDNIDSANINPGHWEKMVDAIEKKYDTYDGFVITHGTNSMAYTSSALSFVLQNIGKPVVLTGAQIPGHRIETDAKRNFVNAVRLATMNVSGVMLVFDEEVILGSRASKVSESKLNAFETINWDLLGEIRIDIRLSDEAKPRHKKKLKPARGFDANIAVETLVPGMPAQHLSRLLESGVRGLIIRGYGPGDIGYEYLNVLKKAQQKKIPVVMTTQCIEGATLMHLNDVGKQALDAGAIQAYDMSLEAVVTKLMWALHRAPYEEIKDIMHTNYTGEINKEGKIY